MTEDLHDALVLTDAQFQACDSVISGLTGPTKRLQGLPEEAGLRPLLRPWGLEAGLLWAPLCPDCAALKGRDCLSSPELLAAA